MKLEQTRSLVSAACVVTILLMLYMCFLGVFVSVFIKNSKVMSQLDMEVMLQGKFAKRKETVLCVHIDKKRNDCSKTSTSAKDRRLDTASARTRKNENKKIESVQEAHVEQQ